jgi:hypothetical protein
MIFMKILMLLNYLYLMMKYEVQLILIHFLNILLNNLNHNISLFQIRSFFFVRRLYFIQPLIKLDFLTEYNSFIQTSDWRFQLFNRIYPTINSISSSIIDTIRLLPLILKNIVFLRFFNPFEAMAPTIF